MNAFSWTKVSTACFSDLSWLYSFKTRLLKTFDQFLLLQSPLVFFFLLRFCQNKIVFSSHWSLKNSRIFVTFSFKDHCLNMEYFILAKMCRLAVILADYPESYLPSALLAETPFPENPNVFLPARKSPPRLVISDQKICAFIFTISDTSPCLFCLVLYFLEGCHFEVLKPKHREMENAWTRKQDDLG